MWGVEVSEELLEIVYRVSPRGHPGLVFTVRVDPRTGLLTRGADAFTPQWTSLEDHPCDGCDLPPGSTHCPVALALAEVVEKCAGLQSHTEVHVRVDFGNHVIAADTTLHLALRSLVGLLMAASGCPSTVMLRPMAPFHLPFADERESLWRVVGNYLLAQYFRRKQNLSYDMELEGLRASYQRLHTVNENLKRRLLSVQEYGPNINAILLLDLFAQEFPFAIEANLADLESLYIPFLRQP